MKYLEEFKALNLPSDKYAIFGSGALAIRGLRENQDIDVLVSEDLYETLSKKHEFNEKGNIEIGNIEIFKDMNLGFDPKKMISEAEEIDGMKFVKLSTLRKWKSEMGREKDLKDIELIDNYLKDRS